MSQAIVQRLEPRRLLNAGDLDLFYGTGGISSNFANEQQHPDIVAHAVVALPDGRAYVGGKYFNDVRLGRLDFDGKPDPTFGNGGYVTTDILGGSVERIRSLVVQPDEKLVAASFARGIVGDRSLSSDFALLRYDKFGALDPTFGNNGLVLTNLGNGVNNAGFTDDANKVILQPDGKLILMGRSNNGNRPRAAIVRYNANGTLDTTFGSGGILIFDLNGGTSGGNITSGVVLPDGKLLFVGYTSTSSSVLRLLSNGAVDTTFGTNGTLKLDSIPFTYSGEMIEAPGGGFFIVARGDKTFGLVRVTDAGTLDTTWGTNGSCVLYTLPSSAFYSISGTGAVGLQSDGSLIVSHEYWYGWYLARVLPNGQPDATFGKGGIVEQNLGSYGKGGTSLALQPGGRVLVAGGGSTYPVPVAGGLLAARYWSVPETLGVSLDPATKIAQVNGDNNPNTVVVSRDLATNDVLVTIDGIVQSLPAADVQRVDVRSLNGNDSVTYLPGAPPGMIDLGADDDIVLLSGVNADVPRKVFGGSGNDTFTLSGSGSGLIEIDGGAGTADSVILSGTSGDDLFTLANSAPSYAMGFTFTQTEQTESVVVNAGGGADVINVPGTLTPRAIINGEEGDDDFYLLPTSKNAYGYKIGVTVTISGGSGSDNLRYTATTNAVKFTVGTSSLSEFTTSNVECSFSQVEDVYLTGSGGNDTFTLSNLTVSLHANGVSGVDSLLFPGSAADDVVSITPSLISREAGQFAALANIDTVSVFGAAGNDTFTMTSASTALAVTVSGDNGDDVLNINSAPWASVNFAGGTAAGYNDTLNVNTGTYTFASDALQTSLNLTLNVASGASAVFNSTQHLASLNLNGGKAAFPAGGNAKVLVTKALSINGGGVLNLATQDLIVDYPVGVPSPIGNWNSTSYTGLTGSVADGSALGGIYTSSEIGGSTELGIAEAFEARGLRNGATALWSGQTIDATSVLVKYTYAGDANLDGVVNADDYAWIDLYSQSPGANTYLHGDFNYDGAINADDYALIDLLFLNQGNPL